MANRTLTGDDWSTPGDWGGTKPVDDDTAIIPATNANRALIMSGDEGGLDVDLLTVHHGFKGTFGVSATPLALAGDLIRVYGSSGFYMECDHDDAATHTCDVTLLQCRNANTPVELGSVAQVGGFDGKWDKVKAQRCNLTVKSNIVWTATGLLEVGYVSNPAGDVRVSLAASGPTLPTLRQNGGRVESHVVIAAGEIAGGILVQDDATPVLLHVYRGATLQLDHTAATTIYVHDGGTLDLLKNAKYKTITTLYLDPLANVIWEQDTANTPGLHLVTNLYDYRSGPD